MSEGGWDKTSTWEFDVVRPQAEVSRHVERIRAISKSTGRIYLAINVARCIQKLSTECVAKSIAYTALSFNDAAAVAKYGSKLISKGHKIIGTVLKFAGKNILSKLPIVGLGIKVYDIVKHANENADAVTLTVDAINVVASAAQVVMLFVPGIAVACPPCGAVIFLVGVGASVIGEAVVKIRGIMAELEAISAEITLSELTQWHLGAAAFFGDNGIDLLKDEANLTAFHRDFYGFLSTEVNAIKAYSKTVAVFEIANDGELWEALDQNVDLRETTLQEREVYLWADNLHKQTKTNEITSINWQRSDIKELERLDRDLYQPSSVSDFIESFMFWCFWCDQHPIQGTLLRVDKRELLQRKRHTNTKLEDAMRVYGVQGKGDSFGFRTELCDVIALGEGTDTAISDPRHKAHFVIADGLKVFQGSKQDDVFSVFTKSRVYGWCYGREGYDMVEFIDDIDNVGLVELHTDVEYIVGRENQSETINVGCNVNYIDLKGGDRSKKTDDSIRIYPQTHHFPRALVSAKEINPFCAPSKDSPEPFSDVTIVVHHNTHIQIFAKGSFNYILMDHRLQVQCSDKCLESTHFIEIPYYSTEVEESIQPSTRAFFEGNKYLACEKGIKVLAERFKNYRLRMLYHFKTDNDFKSDKDCIWPYIVYKK